MNEQDVRDALADLAQSPPPPSRVDLPRAAAAGRRRAMARTVLPAAASVVVVCGLVTGLTIASQRTDRSRPPAVAPALTSTSPIPTTTPPATTQPPTIATSPPISTPRSSVPRSSVPRTSTQPPATQAAPKLSVIGKWVWTEPSDHMPGGRLTSTVTVNPDLTVRTEWDGPTSSPICTGTIEQAGPDTWTLHLTGWNPEYCKDPDPYQLRYDAQADTVAYGGRVHHRSG